MPRIDALWRDTGDPWNGVRDLDDRQGFVAVGRASKMAEQDHFESFVARNLRNPRAKSMIRRGEFKSLQNHPVALVVSESELIDGTWRDLLTDQEQFRIRHVLS